MNKHRPFRVFVLSRFRDSLLLLVLVAACSSGALARTMLKNICRVKGQEEVTLTGLGLVVGLKGTGDGADAMPTIRALAKSMEVMGFPLSPATGRGQGGVKELKDAKNVALVMVTATVPATGAQRGEKLDCKISALSAKSLYGGQLFVTPLLGPDVKSRRVFALAQGQVELDDPQKAPATAKVHRGCRLEEDFIHDGFVEAGKFMLVLDKDHADFQVAADIAELINTQLLGLETKKAKALDQVRIEVPIPDAYLNNSGTDSQSFDPVLFVSQVLSQVISEPEVEARVVINQRIGSVVINGDVEIGSVLVTHKNIVVEAGATAPTFVALDPEERGLTPEEKTRRPQTTKLKSLLEALNAVRARPEDIIEIIKGLERNGKLHGKLIIE